MSILTISHYQQKSVFSSTGLSKSFLGLGNRCLRALLGALFFVAASMFPVILSFAGEWDFSGKLSGEGRLFPQAPGYVGQKNVRLSPALAFEPEWAFRNEDDSLDFQPFIRFDGSDNNRTHADIRVARWLHRGDNWDLVIGLDKVFWGVTESVHLADIVNQTDFVEDIDGEDKLGQPMVNFNLFGSFGTIGIFLLPGFRERTFADADARFRSPLPIDVDNPVYASGQGNRHVDFAARWARPFGGWDIGLSHFYGTSREPGLLPRETADGPVFVPHYDVIHQTGVELQYTSGAWLWKLEGIVRSGHGERFLATVGGFEYTMFQAFGGNADLGLLVEYQYDGRDEDDAPPTIADNDIFLGLRLALNDEQSTALLAGSTIDLSSGATLIVLEAQRRIGNNWMIELEARLFSDVPDDDIAAFFRDDSVITLRLSLFY